ncbi:TonB-dependent receptor domain-containing protein [Sphingomonas sp. ERG5]|uniref:TonB-dependent receptor domain-containing protein n=1 Tax=Sphingomonas sp. ERG5 TaxID=1381597 RepID=UPI00054B3335|nr:TonB-dependent receptor [Sphingomonas sp. ERG5]
MVQSNLLGLGVAVSVLVATSPAYGQTRQFDIPAGGLKAALKTYIRQSGVQLIYRADDVRDKSTRGVKGVLPATNALDQLLAGTGLAATRDAGGAVMLGKSAASAAPQRDSGDTDDLTKDIIVTAQKRVERVQDVPIATSVFSAKSLDEQKIEGGAELLRGVPNMNFSKGNFSMYNIAIRGIGTKAVSASSDPAVAVAFNNTPLIRNRLFESEFFDMERVEVLRGPQGTLYGRNATAGVVNLIPALPGREFDGLLKAEVGNYNSTRLSGMINLPITGTLAIRGAGAMTRRDGYDFNIFTQKRVNDRKLWSTRGSVAWEPSSQFKASAIWQHFEENDNRSRTGKQLCARDPGVTGVGGARVPDGTQVDPFGNVELDLRGRLSQGCSPVSLYDDKSYGAPNGDSMVYSFLATQIGLGFLPPQPGDIFLKNIPVVKVGDPYADVVQSRNLREIATSYDPIFRAKNDVFQFNMEFEATDRLKLVSQTAYARDGYYSSQDYNRFVAAPKFNDSTQSQVDITRNPIDTIADPGPTPGGRFCDQQLGCSDRMVSADLSRSRNRQWTQELRLQSDFAGPINFNVGANYLDFKTQDDYYVFNNYYTLLAQYFYNRKFLTNSTEPCPLGYEGRECIYTDPNPIGKLNDQGHNYFLSRNRVRTKSTAFFGELYWKAASNVKITAGLRYTIDRKISSQIPSQTLLGGGTDASFPGGITGGRVNSGYPALPDIHQKWGALTGRLVVDWKPNLSFTDDTLIYASSARGYKGGGTNPPRVDFNPAVVQFQSLPQTFAPEYVNAFEIGTKNSIAGGRFTLNATGFFNDYKNYQVSQIVDRISLNENFGATTWGLELETAWRPSRAFRIDANLGYLRTRLKKGAQSIDVMNRTQGNPDWMVVRPWLQTPSNCIAPRALVEKILANPIGLELNGLAALCPGASRIGGYNPDPNVPQGQLPYYLFYNFTYNPFAAYNPATVGLNIDQGGSGAPNGGRGFYANLEGNELPNSPHLTFNIGAQYSVFLDDWNLTFRGDYYRQSKSYARIYNTAYDRLKGWDNVNLAVTLARSQSDLTFQLYVKNVFNGAPITDSFTNSDDGGLTTNVFTLDPRIIGFSVAKKF